MSLGTKPRVNGVNLPPGMRTIAATKKKMKPLMISSDVAWRTISNTNPVTMQAKEDEVDKRSHHDSLLFSFPGGLDSRLLWRISSLMSRLHLAQVRRRGLGHKSKPLVLWKY